MKDHAKKYSEYIDKSDLSSKKELPHPEVIFEYIENLNQLSIDLCIKRIFGLLEAYNKFKKNLQIDQFLADFDQAIDTVIKEKKYHRMSEFSDQSVDTTFLKNIPNLLHELTYDEVIIFVAEIAGAWVLTYPVNSIVSNDPLSYMNKWANEEKDYVYALRRLLDAEIEEWIK